MSETMNRPSRLELTPADVAAIASAQQDENRRHRDYLAARRRTEIAKVRGIMRAQNQTTGRLKDGTVITLDD